MNGFVIALGCGDADVVRIPSARAEVAKIGIGRAAAALFRQGWDGGCRGVRILVKERVLIAKEELGALSFGDVGDDNRSADDAAELVAMDVIGHGCEVIPGVEVAVAQELEGVTMELAAARLGHDVNDCAGALAEFGVVVAGLNAELLKCVGEWEWTVDVGHFIHVVAAVEEVIRLVGKCTVGAGDYGSRKCFSIALVDAVALVSSVDYSGNQRDKRRCISAVQGKIDDASFVDDLRQGAGGGVDLRCIARNAHGLSGGANGHLDIDSYGLVGLKRNTGLRVALKSSCGNGY